MNTLALASFIKWAKTTDLRELICKNDDISVEITTEKNAFSSYLADLTKVVAPAIGKYHKGHGLKIARLKEGMQIKKGQFLGFIEMNNKFVEVLCPKNGELKAISVKEKGFVEYGQPLFFID